ncbi:C4-dicarboxylate ABC transporter substrate-binding protein [Marinobacterium aestuarii]|uniref:C4-dicarboxylate ABC transporter substrate-binding protein n=1 Tax=Marinobacterium aestuarii TaxID=1821621 RepID=A0A1A9F2B0_9GAMM|nr:tripartite tricarboxylate transporter substrate-binding protein [Marinobacterium aestuarii]ANG64454.1 C4-dicarboxylate ABC transporter substrate-binding protein [Marinobacterium aestuarii]
MTRNIKFSILTAAIFSMAMQNAFAFEPGNKVECIAPSTPGGGWDFTCRSAGKVLSELGLVPRSVQTVNMPGASGAVGFSHVISKRQGEENLLVATSTAMASQMAQGKYPGGPDQVSWIGTLGSDYGIIAVSNDSKYQSLSELLEALKDDPNSVKFTGGSGVGGWDHLKVLMTARAAGVENIAKITWLASHGGGSAITQVIGGHVSAYSGDISEAGGFIKSGDLRVLAVLSPERLEGEYASVPTAKEQGVDVIGPNWRGFYMPGGISEEVKDYWTHAIDTLYTSEEWKEMMARNGLMPFHVSGEGFEIFVKKQIDDMRSLSKEIGLMK